MSPANTFIHHCVYHHMDPQLPPFCYLLSTIIRNMGHYINTYVFEYGFISASLNSSFNPLIYFLVGREKRGRSRERIKKILEKMFKEEETYTETVDPSVETQL
ncbi:hypothetical protein JD844_015567 [Phrynosoma platyrhinos]|uniref:Uncharacterized protein n=1 Tax=Phrynosoma platyrhinos TaxID=52577 RepID=A0ABQ7SJA9_PHRPL|nr:hypothetical protein JD844_015567 [Phrynosoma platyrhinos]